MAKDLTKIRHKPPFRQIGKLLRKIRQHYLIGLLLAIISVLCYLNYQPGTFLTGWDNLHPEYNLPVNLGRALNAVWQEYQSLGLLAGMAHSADLPRQLFLILISSFQLDLSLYRYLWTFLMLFLGPIGTYFLIYRIFLRRQFDHDTNHFASFLAGLFYLLNLSTLQHFFTPFETFIAFYGFLPWLIYFFLSYLEHPKTSNLLLLFLVSFVAVPSFVTETLFVVFGLCLLCFFIRHLNHHKLGGLPHVILSSLVIFIANSFWLIPNIFFVLTNGSVGINAKMNLMSTPETYYRNLEFGNLQNLSLLKGFWFNFLDLASGNKFDYLMTPWRTHVGNPIIYLIGYFSFFLVLTGIVYSFKKKIPYTKPFLAIFLICYFFLLGGGLLINSHIPLLGELFRSPFTKFSSVLALTYSIFFSVGCIFLLDIFSFLHTRLTYFLTLFTVTVALIIFMTPAFTGYLISPSMRLRVPSEYFDLFDYFQSQDLNTRIANFPQHTFYGWNYYNWGYRGSGFLWYGIKQPILDRAFDVWDLDGEKYYEEISSAIYSENQIDFQNTLDKYAVNWLVIDNNVISGGSDTDLGFGKLQKFLDNNSKFTLVKNFNDHIFVYKNNLDPNIKNFLSLGISQKTKIQSPFGDLSLRPTSVDSTNTSITLNSKLQNQPNTQLFIPSYSQAENLTPYAVTYRKLTSGVELKFQPILPTIKLNGKTVGTDSASNLVNFTFTSPQSGLILAINDQYYEIQLPDELNNQTSFYPLTTTYLPSHDSVSLALYQSTPSYKLDLTNPLSKATPYQCFTNKPNRKIEKISSENTISLFGTDLVGCLSTPIPQPTDLNQLLSLEFTYSSPVGTPGNANLTDTSLGGLISPQPLIARKQSTFTRVFAKPLTRPLQANLILEANETKTTQEIDYKNVQVGYLPLLGESTLQPVTQTDKNIPITGTDSQTLSVELPLLDNLITSRTDSQVNHLNAEASNCDNFNAGKYTRSITPDGFVYAATNANSCDQINLKNFPHSTNYGIIADIQNHTGLFPTVCLENYSTRRCDIFERLVNGKQLILDPISNSNEPSGFTLHLFNQSFGTIPVENLVKSVIVTPLPLNYLKNISLNLTSSQGQNLKSEITNSAHPAEFLYQLSVNTTSDQTISLYQTHSPYWKALEVSQSDSHLPLWLLIAKLPHLYFFGSGSSHLTSNNSSWYNSWNLPSGNHNLVIFYLPQYLEFIGFMLLPLPLIASLIYLLIRKKKTKD